jgi:hypothetical protein
MSRIQDLLIETSVRLRGRRAFAALDRDARDPEAAQARALARVLCAQAATEYGTQHGFARIRSVEEYRRRVPINDYEDLRPWIERQDDSGDRVINHEMPASYALTSGTTGQPKFIPILKSTLEAHKRTQDLFTYSLLRDRPRIFKGHILAIVSPAVEGVMPGSGIPFGSASGQIYEGIPAVIQSKYVVPPAVSHVSDYDTKYLLILRLALAHRDVSYISTANPSTLVRLLALATTHWDELVLDVERGGFHRADKLPAAVQEAVASRLVARPARAVELRRLRRHHDEIRIRDLWPELQAVGVWTGGSCQIFFEQLAGQFSEQTLIRDVGYLSSEFRGAVPLSAGSQAGVPTFRDNFFEFVQRDAWDAGRHEFKGLHELVDGEQYYVFVTTDAGLYRYHMNDILEVSGFYANVPLLRFVQKGKGVTNISGEKLYESQVIGAVAQVEAKVDLQSSFYLMVADEARSRYELYYEPQPDCDGDALLRSPEFARLLDDALRGANIEYATKRQSGRIHAPVLSILRPGSYERYKRACLAEGQREGQFKIVALQYRRELRFDFDSARLGREDVVDEVVALAMRPAGPVGRRSR